MTINQRVVGSATILDLDGRLTIEAAGLLKDKVRGLLHQGIRQLVLNLGDVPHIDSTGLSELVSTYASVTLLNGRVGLLSPSRRVRDLLTATRLLTVFDVFESEAEVVRSLGT